MMTVRVTLNCALKVDAINELTAFLQANIANVRGFSGNSRVNVLFNQDHSEMLLDEEWLSIESHQAYIHSIEQSGVLAQLAEFLSAPPKIRYFSAASL